MNYQASKGNHFLSLGRNRKKKKTYEGKDQHICMKF